MPIVLCARDRSMLPADPIPDPKVLQRRWKQGPAPTVITATLQKRWPGPARTGSAPALGGAALAASGSNWHELADFGWGENPPGIRDTQILQALTSFPALLRASPSLRPPQAADKNVRGFRRAAWNRSGHDGAWGGERTEMSGGKKRTEMSAPAGDAARPDRGQNCPPPNSPSRRTELSAA